MEVDLRVKKLITSVKSFLVINEVGLRVSTLITFMRSF